MPIVVQGPFVGSAITHLANGATYNVILGTPTALVGTEKLLVYRSVAGDALAKNTTFARMDVSSGNDTSVDSTASIQGEVRVTGVTTVGGSTLAGIRGNGLQQSSGAVTELVGLYGTARVSGAGAKGTVGGQAGVVARYGFESAAVTGSITFLYGYYADRPEFTNTVGGRLVTNCFGYYVADQSRDGITNSYGVYIEAQSTGATSSWALYSAGGNSSHAGLLRLGDNTAPIVGFELTGTNALSGASFTDGRNLPVSAANTGRLRYASNDQQWELSQNGAAYFSIVGKPTATTYALDSIPKANASGLLIETGATVTGTNLVTLTNGSNADALHTHAAVSGTATTYTATSGEALTTGQLVCLADAAGVPRIFRTDADLAGRKNVFGITNTTAGGAGVSVVILLAGERAIADALWDAVPGTADVGSPVFMSATAGNLTLSAPGGPGSVQTIVGYVSTGGAGAVRVVLSMRQPIAL